MSLWLSRVAGGRCTRVAGTVRWPFAYWRLTATTRITWSSSRRRWWTTGRPGTRTLSCSWAPAWLHPTSPSSPGKAARQLKTEISILLLFPNFQYSSSQMNVYTLGPFYGLFFVSLHVMWCFGEHVCSDIDLWVQFYWPYCMCFLCSFCKGFTLYSFVRERGHLLDINKTRQIAQDIVKVSNPWAVSDGQNEMINYHFNINIWFLMIYETKYHITNWCSLKPDIIRWF